MMLEIENLEGGYGRLQILNGVSMKVNEREIIAIIGPNGAGKTTLLKAIYKLSDVYKGKIKFEGKDITRLSTEQIALNGIAFVPQGRMVFTTMTVEENLDIGAYILNDKGIIEKRKEEVFTRFPILKERRRQRAALLSGGQQQMLSIGRALMLKPKLLLMDEPSLGLAPKTMNQIFEKIKEINKEGTTIMIVEQNARKAIEAADRTYILETGKVALEGGKNIIRSKRVKELYLGH